MKMGSNSVNTLTGLWFLHSALPLTAIYHCTRFLFNSLELFQIYAPDKLFIAKIIKGSNSVNTVDRVMVLALCTFADDPLSMYQFLFHSLVLFQRYATDKLFIAKNKKREVTP